MLHPKESAACIALLCSTSAFAQITFNVSSIAHPGDAAPVPPQLAQVYSVSLNDNGDVAFGADNAVLLRSGGVTRIVAAFPDPAPVGAGAFTYADSPAVNPQGEVAFVSLTTDNEGLFLWTAQGIQTVAQLDDPAPGGGTFYAFDNVATSSDGGQLLLQAFVQTFSGIRDGLFVLAGSTARLVASTGDPAPGGGTFRRIFSRAVNVNGQVAFFASLNPSGSGIFLSQQDGTIIPVARAGDPSPLGGRFDFGLRRRTSKAERISGSARRASLAAIASSIEPDGAATFTSFNYPIAINDLGDVTFAASSSLVGRGGVFVFSNGLITRVIREGDPLPGGGTISFVGGVSVNAAGQIAFLAYADDFIDHGVFLLSPDRTMTSIGRLGGPSPEGDVFTVLFSPKLNGVGQVAFLSELAENLGGAYLWSEGSIARVAGQGDVLDREPKFISALFQRVGGIDGAGRVLFGADLFPGGFGLFLGNPNAVLARVGDPAPGGGVFDYVYSGWSSMNESGEAIFAGSTSSVTNYLGLYSSQDGMLSRIAAMGDPAPGGGRFSSFFGATSISRSGDVAFYGTASSPRRTGFFLYSKGEFRSVAMLGDPAPGGGTFSQLPYLTVNDQHQVAFPAAVTAPGRTGIFRWSEKGIDAIAQNGDPAPGGGTFNFPFAPNFFYPTLAPSSNNLGDVAFGASLTGQNPGVYKWSGGEIASVAINGDPISRGGTIIIARSASLNDAGQVAFLFAGTERGGVGLFSESTRSSVVLLGDPMPGGGTFFILDFPLLNANLQIGFPGGQLDGTSGVFLANPIR